MTQIPNDVKQKMIATQLGNSSLYGNNGVGSGDGTATDYNRLQTDSNYTSAELARANFVKQNRSSQGLDTSEQDSYINQLQGLQQQHVQSAQQQDQQQLDSLGNTIKQQGSSMFDNQKAMLDQSKSSQLNDLAKAYQDAVAQGHLSEKEAQQAFDQHAVEINQQKYSDAERTNLTAQDRGIQNSQQLLGLQAGDNARANSMVNSNMSERDKRLSDIRDRINTITAQNASNVSNVNTQYDAGLRQARSASDQMVADKMFTMNYDNFKTNKDFAHQASMADLANQYQLGGMRAQHGYQVDEANVQHGLRLDEMMVGHKFDMEKVAADFQNSLTLENTRFGHQSSLQSSAQAASAQKAKDGYLQKAKDEEAAYQTALAREGSKFTPGTPEYKVREQQLQDQLQANLAAAKSEAIGKATMANDLATVQGGAPQANPSWYQLDPSFINMIDGGDASSLPDWLNPYKNTDYINKKAAFDKAASGLGISK